MRGRLKSGTSGRACGGTCNRVDRTDAIGGATESVRRSTAGAIRAALRNQKRPETGRTAADAAIAVRAVCGLSSPTNAGRADRD